VGNPASAARWIINWVMRFHLTTAPRLADLFRCVTGNPFHPGAVKPAWRTAEVARLAKAAYQERSQPDGLLDPSGLVRLADALEDAGCADPAILGHLLGPELHVRGCWPVDLILNKG
jgi:hypothetical protein